MQNLIEDFIFSVGIVYTTLNINEVMMRHLPESYVKGWRTRRRNEILQGVNNIANPDFISRKFLNKILGKKLFAENEKELAVE